MRRGGLHVVLRAALVLAAFELCSARALAQPCSRPDLVYAFPPHEARGVPTDATLSARYRSTAVYQGEEVVLSHESTGERPVDAFFDEAESMLGVIPPDGLEPGEEYVIRWPRLRGIGSASLGRGRNVTFRVGTGPDEDSPSLEGLRLREWDLDRERDECTDSLEDRYVFDMEIASADDDGGRESLAIVVFQTKGPHIAHGKPEPVDVRPVPEEDRLAIRRPVSDAIGQVCFAAIARDLTGKVSSSGSEEVCTKTIDPPFFEGCAVRPGRPEWPAAWLLLIVGLFSRRAPRRAR